MSEISSVSSNIYSNIASGSKLQTAADGAADLAIVEKENSQINGYDKGTENAQTATDMLNVTDAALSSVSDYLQRMRELALGASNAIMSDDDKKAIQAEIDQIKQGINDVASQTQFNTKNLLDGSSGTMNIAVDGSGNSFSIQSNNSTLKALGLEDFDVTKDFNIDDIDKAIDSVSTMRSNVGSKTNALSYAMNYNQYASYNLTSAKSKKEDEDIAKAATELKKNEILSTYKIMMQKKQQEQQANKLTMFFM